MIPIPAIDIRKAEVVRLTHGDFNQQTTYSSKPSNVALQFQAQGAQRIHIVDLDGALGGKPSNALSVESILKKVTVPIEIGGGIRDIKTIDFYLNMGVSWVVLGTQACLDHGFLKEALDEFGSKIIIGIDAVEGKVATDGWTKITTIKAIDLAKKAESLGLKSLIYTDIKRDGALQGPNLDQIKELAKDLSLDIIASGGVSSLNDIDNIQKLNISNITGVIIGKAIYENKFSVQDAVKRCSQNA